VQNELALSIKILMVKDERLVILLVDDSEWVIHNMIGILQDLDNIRIIFQASSYQEAVRMITEIEPDVVLMDIFLDEKINFDLLKFLTERYPAIEPVIISNHVSQQYRDACLRIGPHHFFDKSSDLGLIIKLISGKYGNTGK
jgi:DNA-binding NarL/FixJ family response regulator